MRYSMNQYGKKLFVFSMMLIQCYWVTATPPVEKSEELNRNGYFTPFSSDLLNWDEKRYNMHKSPLSYFKDYKNLFSQIGSPEIDRTFPVIPDKNYSAIWKLVRDTLYLCDITFSTEFPTDKGNNIPSREIYQKLETLTNTSFESRPDISQMTPENRSDRMMRAKWVNGFFYIKEVGGLESRDVSGYRKWYSLPYNCLTFKDGVLTSNQPIKGEEPDWLTPQTVTFPTPHFQIQSTQRSETRTLKECLKQIPTQ